MIGTEKIMFLSKLSRDIIKELYLKYINQTCVTTKTYTYNVLNFEHNRLSTQALPNVSVSFHPSCLNFIILNVRVILSSH